MSSAGHSRLSLRVEGRVQGVGFRYSALRQAQRLGLTGWVRNTHDGAVELVAEGPDGDLAQLLDWCRSGPAGARVTAAHPRWSTADGSFADFGIRR